MTRAEFVERTKQFALAVVTLVEDLPVGRTADVIGKQLLRSGTSVGANYRAACRAKSTLDIIHKLSIVEEEADESLFWMELLIEGELMRKTKLASLMAEADEIIARIVSSNQDPSRKTESQSKIQNLKSKIEIISARLHTPPPECHETHLTRRALASGAILL